MAAIQWRVGKWFRSVLLLQVLVATGWCQVNVVTYHYDNFRTGQNLHESVLTPTNVNSTSFGKLFSQPVDGQIYAQPVELQSVTVPGKGQHNIVYVATENDSVYAFDADSNAGINANPLWQDSFIDPANGITPIPSTDVGTKMIYPQIGITSTPVIDPNTGTLYVVAASKENGKYFQRLHALDVASGAEKFGGPVVIQANVPGDGWGAMHGKVYFDPLRNNQRAALLLSRGIVYIAWASHGLETTTPFHGWAIGYDAHTLHKLGAFCVTPNGEQGGIWQSGGGIAADVSGNLFILTSNGTFDANSGGVDFGMSYLKIAPAMGVVDYFTPYNEGVLSQDDIDLGSGGPLLLPDQSGTSHPMLAVGAGKNSTIYLVDRTQMGGFSPTSNQNLENIPNAFAGHGLFATPAYFAEKLYFGASGDVLRIFQITNGLISPTPIATSKTIFSGTGATPVISANGSADGIVWMLRFTPKNSSQGYGGPATLFAFDPVSAALLYDSDQAGSRDMPPNSIKFATPIVANGKVYFGTATELDVFGLLSPKASAAETRRTVARTAGSPQVDSARALQIVP
jgi:hypothetical protein